MNVLVIGGTRFMGPDVVSGLVEKGHNVTVLHRGQTIAKSPAGVNQITGDRDNIEKYKSAIMKCNPDVVIDMILLNEQQADELLNVISGIARKLVVVSSGDVYHRYDLLRGVETGPAEHHPLKEDAPLREKLYPYRDMASGPEDYFYSYDKILVERKIMASPDVDATVVRLPFVYGPRDYQHRLFEYIKRMDDNRPAIMLEESQAACRMTRGFRTNCAEAIITVSCDNRSVGRIYNVGEEVAHTEEEWVSKIAEVTGWKGKVVIIPKPEMPEHLKSDLNWDYHINVDTSRIRKELGYKDLIPLDEALSQTIAWERENSPSNMDKSQFDYQAEDKVLSRLEKIFK